MSTPTSPEPVFPAGNPDGIDLTRLVESILPMLAEVRVHPATFLDALLTHLAEDEGGRGGVDAYVIRDADGELVDYVVAPHEEW